MCITASVGKRGVNRPQDVRIIQALLNMCRSRTGIAAPLATDGKIGRKTIAAIGAFQRAISGATQPDCRVDCGGITLGLLRQFMPKRFTREKLQGIMAAASEALVASYFKVLTRAMAASSIDTPLRIAHFLAQIGHESGELRYCEELASGDAYEGRLDLGNREPGDGRRFKGRGLIQLTGRANYQAYSDARGADFVTGANPHRIASEPALAADVAVWFWTVKRLNRLADRDDLRGITRRINGGFNGLADRCRRLARAKWFLNVEGVQRTRLSHGRPPTSQPAVRVAAASRAGAPARACRASRAAP